jgi:hypothetical protein
VTAGYSQNWEDGDTSSLGAEILKALQSAGGELSEGGGMDGAKAAMEAGTESLKASGKKKYPAIKKLLKDQAISTVLGEAAVNYEQSRTQRIINTKREMLYKGTDFRTFNFEFDIAPTSEREVLQTMGLIKGLKYWSAPSKADGGETIKFPAFFQIDFLDRLGGAANDNFGLKIGKSVLTKLEVNYTPDGLWQTFKGGFPIHIKLNLEFKEIELIYRESITKRTIY